MDSVYYIISRESFSSTYAQENMNYGIIIRNL